MIIDKLGVNEALLTNHTLFYDDLDVDSLDFCELIVDIENAFNITIEDDQYTKIKTVGALINFVAQKTKNKPENRLLQAHANN